MKFENQELETSFEIPDVPNVRLRLRYDSAVTMFMEFDLYERLWNGVRAVAQEWKSAHIELDGDLEKLDKYEQAEVVKWAGLELWSVFRNLKTTPKN